MTEKDEAQLAIEETLDLLHDWIVSGTNAAWEAFETSFDENSKFKQTETEVFQGSPDKGNILYWACGTHLWDMGHAKRRERLAEAVAFLIDSGVAWDTSFNEAVRMGWSHILQIMEEKGLPVFGILNDGSTVLHRMIDVAIQEAGASQASFTTDFIVNMADIGANVNAAGTSGVWKNKTPLQYALTKKAFKCALALNSFSEPSSQGVITALCNLAEAVYGETENINTFESFIKNQGVDFMMSMAEISSANNLTEIVSLLAKWGAPMDVETVLNMAGIPNGTVNDAFVAAVENKWLGVVPFLLNKGADVHSRTPDGKLVAQIYLEQGGGLENILKHKISLNAPIDSESKETFIERNLDSFSWPDIEHVFNDLKKETIQGIFTRNALSDQTKGFYKKIVESFPEILLDSTGKLPYGVLLTQNGWDVYSSLLSKDTVHPGFGNRYFSEVIDSISNVSAIQDSRSTAEIERLLQVSHEVLKAEGAALNVESWLKLVKIPNFGVSYALKLIDQVDFSTQTPGQMAEIYLNMIQNLFTPTALEAKFFDLMAKDENTINPHVLRGLVAQGDYKRLKVIMDDPKYNNFRDSLSSMILSSGYKQPTSSQESDFVYLVNKLIIQEERFDDMSADWFKGFSEARKQDAARLHNRFMAKNVTSNILDSFVVKGEFPTDILQLILDNGGRANGRFDSLFAKVNLTAEHDLLIEKLKNDKLAGAAVVLEFFDSYNRGDFQSMKTLLDGNLNLVPSLEKYNFNLDAYLCAFLSGSVPLFKTIYDSGLNLGNVISEAGNKIVGQLFEKNDKLMLQALFEKAGAIQLTSDTQKKILANVISHSDMELMAIADKFGIQITPETILDLIQNNAKSSFIGVIILSVLDRELSLGGRIKDAPIFGEILNLLENDDVREKAVELICQKADVKFIDELTFKEKLFNPKHFRNISGYSLSADILSKLFPYVIEAKTGTGNSAIAEIGDALHAAGGLGVPMKTAKKVVETGNIEEINMIIRHGVEGSFSELFKYAVDNLKMPISMVHKILLLAPSLSELKSDLEKDRFFMESHQKEVNLISIMGGESDTDKLIETIRNNSDLLEYACEKIRSNKNFAIASVEVFPERICYFSPEMKADAEVVYAALKKRPLESKTSILLQVNPTLVKELALTGENCEAVLKEVLDPSFFKPFRNIALKKAMELVRQSVSTSMALQSRDFLVNMGVVENSMAKANLVKEESFQMRRILGIARRLVDSKGVELMDSDKSEFRKIIEKNLPELLERYSIIGPNERVKAAKQSILTPSEEFQSALTAVFEKLQTMENRAADYAKTGLMAEAAVLKWDTVSDAQLEKNKMGM